MLVMDARRAKIAMWFSVLIVLVSVARTTTFWPLIVMVFN